MKVLIVEDMFLNSEFLRIWVEALGHEVCGVAVSVDTACTLANVHRPRRALGDHVDRLLDPGRYAEIQYDQVWSMFACFRNGSHSVLGTMNIIAARLETYLESLGERFGRLHQLYDKESDAQNALRTLATELR